MALTSCLKDIQIEKGLAKPVKGNAANYKGEWSQTNFLRSFIIISSLILHFNHFLVKGSGKK